MCPLGLLRIIDSALPNVCISGPALLLNGNKSLWCSSAAEHERPPLIALLPVVVGLRCRHCQLP